MSNEENKQPESVSGEPASQVTEQPSLAEIDVDSLLKSAEQQLVDSSPRPDTAKPESYHNPQVTIQQSPLAKVEDPEKAFLGKLPAHLFRRPDSELSDQLVRFKNSDPAIGEEGRQWLSGVRGAQRHRVSKSLYEKPLHSETAAWLQFIKQGANLLYGRDIKTKVDGRKLSGVRAVQQMRHAMGMAEDREIPLFASGFYINLRAAPDTELSNMETFVLSEKETIGRLTGAAGLSGTAVYLVEHLLRLIMSSMVGTNVDLNNSEDLLDLALITDLQHLALGQGQTIFVKDYPIEVPCTNDYEKCQHLETYGLSLKYMAIHDNNKLTDYQKVHMTDPDRKLSIKDVKDYQAKGPVTVSEVVEINGGAVVIDFKTPTIREYIEDARAWIAGIIAIVDSITDDETTPERRRVLVEDQARLTTLRQYSHFIKSISIRGPAGDSIVTDRESIMINLNDLSSDDQAVQEIVAGVRRHIEAATITIAGVPKTPCPSCESERELTEEEKLHPEYIPVDAVSLFFTQTSLKLRKRQETRLQDI